MNLLYRQCNGAQQTLEKLLSDVLMSIHVTSPLVRAHQCCGISVTGLQVTDTLGYPTKAHGAEKEEGAVRSPACLRCLYPVYVLVKLY